MLDSRPRGRGFEPHRRHCVVSLNKTVNPSLVLVQPRKTRPYITERLLMGRKESNQTNKQTNTSSVTAMLKDLNWGPLDQRCIDSRLMMMYKVTYDLVAIPASLYLVQNTRASRHTPSLAYRQIQTLKDNYRFTFFPRTIIHWNDLPAKIRTLPTLAQFSSAVCQVIHVSPKYQPLVLSKRTLLLALYKLILPPFSITLFQLTPSELGIPEYPSDVPKGVKT